MNPELVRAKSAQVLRTWGVPFLDYLPLLDPIPELREPEQVVHRLLCEYARTGLAHDASGDSLFALLEQSGATAELGAGEEDLFFAELSEAQINELSWSTECTATLAWAGQLLDGDLLAPEKVTAWARFFPHIEVEPAELMERFTLRRIQEIAQQLDIYYLAHAALRHPEAWSWWRRTKPSKYNIIVVEERRRALEWLVDPTTPWDDISLDT